MLTNLDTIERLNGLIVSAKNGEETFRAAADEAFHPELKQSLLQYSACFAETARDLQDMVRRLGGKPAEIGTFGSTLHRTWMHLKATALGRDEETLLEDCEREEDQVKGRFEEVLREEIPGEVHEVIARHYEDTLQHHDEVRALRDKVARVH